MIDSQRSRIYVPISLGELIDKVSILEIIKNISKVLS